MNGAALSDRMVRGTWLGLAVWWVVAGACGAPLSWLLPVCIVAAVAFAGTRSLPPVTVPRALIVGTILTLALVLGAIAWGSCATPSRHWDGAAAWDVKAGFLAAEAATRELFFRDANVFHHSPDYPLLQPMLTAAIGRAVFALLLVLACATLWSALRRSGPGWIAWLATVAFATTPVLISTTSGAADSGYAELLLTTCMLGCAAALALGEPIWLFAALVLTIGAKPEGVLWSLLPVAVAFVRGERLLLRAGLLGLVVGHLVLWRVRATLAPQPGWFLLLPVIVGALVAAVAECGLHARAAGRRVRLGVLAALAGVAGLAAAILGPLAGTGALAQHLQAPERLLQRLASLPAILAGLFDHALVRLHFGAAFLLPLVLAWPRPFVRGPARVVAALLVLGLLLIPLPFLLAPEDDIAHHVKSSMPRLLLQWLGVAWLLAGLQLGERARAAHEPLP